MDNTIMLNKEKLNNIKEPNDVLSDVLKEYPRLQAIHGQGRTTAIFASPERAAIASKINPGGLEYWPKDEEGWSELPHPTNNKGNVLEVYDKSLRTDRKALNAALFGDLLHGMVNDKGWKALRDEFKQNYSPNAKNLINERQGQDDFGTPDTTVDAFIRGGLVPYKGGNWLTQNHTLYSPKQLEIMDRMRAYLKSSSGATGKW